MPFASVNGIDLYYEVHGSGPALLFAHGQGGNHLSWWQQIPFFSQSYTCITFDHRAFGLSRDVDGKGRTAFGADAIGLLDHLGIEKVGVVAHSMGGRTGISIALRATERCRALVLAGNNGGVTNDAILERRRQAVEDRGGLGLGAFSVAPAFENEQPERFHLLKEIGRLNPKRPEDFLTRPGRPPENRAPISERLVASGLPLLFVVGEHDRITPPDMIEMCHQAVPGSSYELIKDSGHSAYYEKPEVFNRAVMAFLQQVDADAPEAGLMD